MSKAQQDKDIETVKRAADGVAKTPHQRDLAARRALRPPGQHISFDGRNNHVGTPEDCIVCSPYLSDERLGLPVEGDLIPRYIEVDESLEYAKQFVTEMGGTLAESKQQYDAVEPPHYKRGPKVVVDIGSQITTGLSKYVHALRCVEVFEQIKDPRLATAFKYLWRVAFGGKREPWDTRPQTVIDRRDIESAIWYLQRYLTMMDTEAAREHGVRYTGEQVLVTDGENVVAVHDSDSEAAYRGRLGE